MANRRRPLLTWGDILAAIGIAVAAYVLIVMVFLL